MKTRTAVDMPSRKVVSKKSIAKAAKIGDVEASKIDDWWAKYCKVEDAVFIARERRREKLALARYKRNREFGTVLELSDGYAARWRRDGFFEGEEFILGLFRDTGYLAYLDYCRRSTSRKVEKMKAAVRRPSYYANENERRRRLAAARRKVDRRYTENPCPTKEQIFEAWTVRRRSHEDAVRFGSLLEDLECYLDNSLRRDDFGVIVGRNGGIKGWFKDNLPALALQYTSVMRYKAQAKKLKQIVELKDPIPLEVILPSGESASLIEGVGVRINSDARFAAVEGDVKEECDGVRLLSGRKSVDRITEVGEKGILLNDNAVGDKGVAGFAGVVGTAGNAGTTSSVDVAGMAGANGGTGGAVGLAGAVDVYGVKSDELAKARAIWDEVVKDVRKSVNALFVRIDELSNPQKVETKNMLAKWKARWENEITGRTKRML